MEIPTRPLTLQELYFKNYIPNSSISSLNLKEGAKLPKVIAPQPNAPKISNTDLTGTMIYKIKTSDHIKTYLVKNWPFLLIAFAGLTLVSIGVYLKVSKDSAGTENKNH
jgi:hypothetical protein